jgi:hypothetical protein
MSPFSYSEFTDAPESDKIGRKKDEGKNANTVFKRFEKTGDRKTQGGEKGVRNNN